MIIRFWLNLYLFKGWLTSFYYEWSWGDWKFIKLCLEAASVEVVSQEQRQNCKVGSFPTSRNGLEQSDFLQYTRFYYITFWLVCQANRTFGPGYLLFCNIKVLWNECITRWPAFGWLLYNFPNRKLLAVWNLQSRSISILQSVEL